MAFEVVERKGEGEWNYHEDAIIDVLQEDPSPPQTSVKCICIKGKETYVGAVA